MAALRSRVRDVLFSSAAAQGRLRLFFVSLVFAESELACWTGDHAPSAVHQSWPWQCADIFAHVIADEDAPTTGALLAFDLGKRHLRPGFHGLVLTARTDLEVDQLWRALGQHCPASSSLRHRVQRVTSSGVVYPWLRIYEDEHPILVEVRDVVRYACKALPGGVDLPVRDRVLASGPFADGIEWDLVLDERACVVCERQLPAGARRDRRTCDGACRVALHRTRKGVTP
jgi:hypothetical protein